VQNLCELFVEFIVLLKFFGFVNNKYSSVILYITQKNIQMVKGRLGTSLKRFYGIPGEKCQLKAEIQW